MYNADKNQWITITETENSVLTYEIQNALIKSCKNTDILYIPNWS